MINHIITFSCQKLWMNQKNTISFNNNIENDKKTKNVKQNRNELFFSSNQNKDKLLIDLENSNLISGNYTDKENKIKIKMT